MRACGSWEEGLSPSPSSSYEDPVRPLGKLRGVWRGGAGVEYSFPNWTKAKLQRYGKEKCAGNLLDECLHLTW